MYYLRDTLHSLHDDETWFQENYLFRFLFDTLYIKAK
jgi:hypothetical protein